MIKFALTTLLFLMMVLSCNKDNTPYDIRVALLEGMNGNYSGNIYHWSRDYDSTHMNVVEEFDTLWNNHASLQINVDSNLIRFDGVEYKVHDDLSSLLNNDTINALIDYSTRPFRTIKIIRSSQFVRVGEAFAAPSGPSAYQVTGEYHKD